MNYCQGFFNFTITNIRNPQVPGAPTGQGEVGAFNAPGKLTGPTLTAPPPTTTPNPCGSAVISSGTGLRGDYYLGTNFDTAQGVRTDATINFNWPTGPSIPRLASTGYSVRWSGSITAKYSGVHTFYTISDDGVRLYVNSVKIIELWTEHSSVESIGTATLVAGQSYPIVLEFYQNAGDAIISLSWSLASCLAKELVPTSQLSPKPLLLC